MIPLSSLTPFQENNMPWFPKKKSHLQQVAFTQKHSPNTCNPYKLPAHKHGIGFRIWCKNGRECRQLLWRYREVKWW